jgi:hypothetical protein
MSVQMGYELRHEFSAIRIAPESRCGVNLTLNRFPTVNRQTRTVDPFKRSGGLGNSTSPRPIAIESIGEPLRDAGRSW